MDVPDLYLASDKPNPRGEIYVRGHCVSPGYLSPDGASLVSALDDDGWLATGDIGSFDAKGRLKVIDRKGDVFKLANGEFVTPSQIEMSLLSTAEVSQVAVYGDPSRFKLVAIVHIDDEAFLRWLEDEGVEWDLQEQSWPKRLQMSAKDRADDACKDPMVRSRFVRRLRNRGRKAGLKGSAPSALAFQLRPDAETSMQVRAPGRRAPDDPGVRRPRRRPRHADAQDQTPPDHEALWYDH